MTADWPHWPSIWREQSQPGRDLEGVLGSSAPGTRPQVHTAPLFYLLPTEFPGLPRTLPHPSWAETLGLWAEAGRTFLYRKWGLPYPGAMLTQGQERGAVLVGSAETSVQDESFRRTS